MMTAVWRLDLSATDKIVLLALADAANDDGVCWTAVRARDPNKLDLLTKCSLSERAIQGAIKRLCAAGLLSRQERPGRGVIYTVTPAADAPPQQMRPAGNDIDPRSRCGETISKPKIELSPRASDEIETDFAEFWKLYPRKIAKPQALKAYVKARKKTDHGTIVAGLAAQIRWGVFAEPQFSPHAATWLNGERWADERDATGSAGMAGRQDAGRGRSRPSGIIGAIARSRAARGEAMDVSRGEASLFGEHHDWREGSLEGEYRASDQPHRNGDDALHPEGRRGHDRPAVGRYSDAD